MLFSIIARRVISFALFGLDSKSLLCGAQKLLFPNQSLLALLWNQCEMKPQGGEICRGLFSL